MSTEPATPADANVALDPQRSVAVNASAGSGKTWLLVSRVLRLLLEGHPPGGVLALTFTRKAAAEMRERLNERLRSLAHADPAEAAAELGRLGLAATPQHLQRARELYQAVLFDPCPPRAMTLHAFCQDLLSRFALEAGVPPGFRLVENDQGLYRRAWRRLLSELRQDEDGAAAQALRRLIALGYGEQALELQVYAFLQHRADWWAYSEDHAEPLAHAAAQLRTALWLDEAAPGGDLDGDAFSGHLRFLWRWLDRVGGSGHLKAERVEAALNSSGDARYQALLDALFRKDGEPLKFQLAKSKRALLSEAEAEHFAEAHREVIRWIEDCRRRRLCQACLERSGAALELGVAALRAMEAELQLEQALTFADLEWRSYRLLRQPGHAEWVRYKLDQKIDHLLVDEFQDTSPTQWRLLLPFLEEMAAGDAGRARSVFIVGDPKQSIYGFRRANPELLAAAEQWLHQHLDAVSLPLNHSRRSAPAVIDFVNALFEPQELAAGLGFERHGTHRGGDWGRVEVAPLIEPEAAPREPAQDAPADLAAEVAGELLLRDPLRTPRQEEEASRAEREGAQVTQRIRALIDSGVAVRGEQGARAIEYGDVMVLARSRTHLQALEQALTAADIPYVGSSRGTLLDTAEARDLLALLRFLNAPHRNLELAQVLRSPLFSAGDDDLVALAAACAEDGTWFEALAGLAPLRPRLQAALDLLLQWLPLAAQLPAHDLLDRIYREADAAARYEAALPAVPAARVRANLGAFIQLALEADSGRYPSLARFLDYLHDLARSRAEAPDEAPPPAQRGQVRVMTIHAAKGLEAATVFLVNSGRLQTARTPRWLIEWPSGAERPSDFLVPGASGERDPHSEDLIQRHQRREEREDLDLLYVAATRARQFLHISGFRQGKAGQRRSWHDLALDAMQRLGHGPATPLEGVADGALHYGSGEAPRGHAGLPSQAPPPNDPRLRQVLGAAVPAHSSPSAADPESFGDAAIDAVAVRRGHAIHLLLQTLAEDRTHAPASLQARLQARLQGAVETAEVAEWMEAAQSVLNAPALQHLFDPNRYHRAWNEVPAGEGIIDRLVDDGDTLWIADYKTTPQTDPAVLLARYRSQLLAYSAAVRRIWPGRPLRAGLVLTGSRQWLELPGSER
jgi:ATP-dependent helicase/nuclease subunit A